MVKKVSGKAFRKNVFYLIGTAGVIIFSLAVSNLAEQSGIGVKWLVAISGGLLLLFSMYGMYKLC
jgi:hypothetical protein